jgi:eukaryotic-like serine/threonine-protein kinase
MSNDPPSVSLATLRRAVGACDRFEAAWRAGGRPRIEEHLGETAGAERAVLFRKLLELEVELRLTAGERPAPQDYRPRFPDSGDVIDAVVAEALAAHPPTAVGRFRLLRLLGAGPAGAVHLAADPLSGKEVALKVLRPEALPTAEARRRFLAGGPAAAALDHPNIVPVREAGEDGPLCYLASEYSDGSPLTGWLRPEGFAVGVAATLTARLADALRHAHDRGVVHLRLKPGNVLLQTAATAPRNDPGDLLVPRLTDFGLAALGAPAPGEVGSSADVYALGGLLYEMLTGRPPQPTPVRPRRLRPEVPRELEAVCLRCLHADPRRRYPSAGELGDALRRWLSRGPDRNGPGPWVARWLTWGGG